MTVNASLLGTAVMLARSGVTAWNPTWQFLRIYHALFARIGAGGRARAPPPRRRMELVSRTRAWVRAGEIHGRTRAGQ